MIMYDESEIIKNRMLFEIGQMLEKAAELFDFLREMDEKMVLEQMTVCYGKTKVKLKYE